MSTSGVKISATLLVLALLVGTPSVTTAQERDGFWIGAGTGFGSASVRCDECDGGREGSSATYLRGGWTANDRLLLGAEFNIWNKKAALEEEVMMTARFYNILGTATFYPSRSAGLFVKGGAGLSVVDADMEVMGTGLSVEIGKGLGLLVGAGYDLRVGRRISVTPAVSFWRGNLGDVKLAGSPLFEDWKHNVIDFTVGITFH